MFHVFIGQEEEKHEELSNWQGSSLTTLIIPIRTVYVSMQLGLENAEWGGNLQLFYNQNILPDINQLYWTLKSGDSSVDRKQNWWHKQQDLENNKCISCPLNQEEACIQQINKIYRLFRKINKNLKEHENIYYDFNQYELINKLSTLEFLYYLIV